MSYAAYSGEAKYLAVFSEDYFNLNCDVFIGQDNCNVDGQHIPIDAAFAQPDTNVAAPLVYGAFGKIANLSVYPGKLDIAFSPFNSVNALVSTAFLEKNSQAQLLQVLEAADVNLTSVADGGVSIITLAHDSIVVPNNYDDLLARYPTKIKTAIKIDENDLMVVSPFSDFIPPIGSMPKAYFVPVDHLQAPIFEYIYALNIFNGF